MIDWSILSIDYQALKVPKQETFTSLLSEDQKQKEEAESKQREERTSKITNLKLFILLICLVNIPSLKILHRAQVTAGHHVSDTTSGEPVQDCDEKNWPASGTILFSGFCGPARVKLQQMSCPTKNMEQWKNHH